MTQNAVYEHENGVKCVWDGKIWYIPLDVGGEGYDCPHVHHPDQNQTVLESIRDKIKQHYIDNPTHGVGCSCMDKYVVAIRKAATISPYWSFEEAEATSKAMQAMEDALHRVSTSLHRFQRSRSDEEM